MNKLDIIRKSKSVFMKWKLHKVVSPFTNMFLLSAHMGQMSKWRAQTPVTGYNDFYQRKWDYSRRVRLYEEIAKAEQLDMHAIDYFEFGVASGNSFKWWISHNLVTTSRFSGFDTFEGLPEKWGKFEKGDMAFAMEALNIHDTRVTFYKGLFQDTLPPFLESYDGGNGRRKVIHMDADLFSSTIFTLSQFYRFLNDGDLILFDEFAVPTHEFLAFKIFTESFYIKYEVIAAANNYLFVAVKIKK